MTTFASLFKNKKPLIGMVHLPPLPGYKGFPGMDELVKHVETEVRLLEELGYDGVLIENEYDQPHRVLAAPETLAAMAILTRNAVQSAKSIVVGTEILLNDPKASLAAAFAGGASFIRTDYFVDRMLRPEYGGEMAIDPEGLIAYRRNLGAERIAIMADIQVKYATMITPRPIGDSASEAKEKGADAIIISGNLTGVAPDLTDLNQSVKALSNYPVFIGSGLNTDNIYEVLPIATGAIVGTGIMDSSGRIVKDKAARLIAQRDQIARN
jgi:membrane complex biogenesis BtpA family protein